MTDHDTMLAGLDRRHFLTGAGAAGLATATGFVPWSAEAAVGAGGAAERRLGLRVPPLWSAADRHGLVYGSSTATWQLSDKAYARLFARHAALLFTDVGRDGLLKGANIDATVDLARQVAIPVIASGGVKGLGDIRVLALHAKDGIEGVITGRALYDGRLDLGAALAVAAA